MAVLQQLLTYVVLLLFFLLHESQERAQCVRLLLILDVVWPQITTFSVTERNGIDINTTKDGL